MAKEFLLTLTNYNDGFSDQWQLQMMRAAQRISQTQIPRQAKCIVDLYDDSDDWIPIYDSQHYLVSIWQSAIAVISTSNGSVVGEMTAELTVACENSHDHDQDPVQFKLEHQERSVSMGIYFRLREVNADNSFSVLG